MHSTFPSHYSLLIATLPYHEQTTYTIHTKTIYIIMSYDYDRRETRGIYSRTRYSQGIQQPAGVASRWSPPGHTRNGERWTQRSRTIPRPEAWYHDTSTTYNSPTSPRAEQRPNRKNPQPRRSSTTQQSTNRRDPDTTRSVRHGSYSRSPLRGDPSREPRTGEERRTRLSHKCSRTKGLLASCLVTHSAEDTHCAILYWLLSTRAASSIGSRPRLHRLRRKPKISFR
jgi:hypothetical protein